MVPLRLSAVARPEDDKSVRKLTLLRYKVPESLMIAAIAIRDTHQPKWSVVLCSPRLARSNQSRSLPVVGNVLWRLIVERLCYKNIFAY
jgi:hypothetical protein